jgi:hypothetical protein
MLGNSIGHGSYALKDSAGGLRIGDLEPVILVEGHDELQRIDRIEAEASRPEQGLAVANLIGGDLEHEVLNDHALEVLFERRRIIHYEMPSFTLNTEPVPGPVWEQAQKAAAD